MERDLLVFFLQITAIQPSWMTDVAPHYYKYTGVSSESKRDSEADKKASKIRRIL